MEDFMTPILIGAVSTLLTLILTPHLQHYFWGYQRMSELRLNVFKEINDLAAEFLNCYMKDAEFHPTDQFYRKMMVATANVDVLFSKNAFKSFKQFESMLSPNLGPAKGKIDKVAEARNAALKALYSEAVAAKLFNSISIGRNRG